MSRHFQKTVAILAAWAALVVLHGPLLRLPYYWDEAGYYVPAALDLWRRGLLIPQSTLATGHTPLLMAYLALAWSAFGFSSLTTRVAMLLVTGATVATTYRLGRTVLEDGPQAREAATWGAVLLAATPLFFAQGSLVHLDLAATLFTVLAVVALLGERWVWFAVAASLAVLSKETAIVLVAVAWLFVWHEARREKRELRRGVWLALLSPGLVLGAWTLFYHHRTGYWIGNPEYLKYNLYSTLSPVPIALRLMRRVYEVGVAGFNWLLASAALAGLWWSRKKLRKLCAPPQAATGSSLSSIKRNTAVTDRPLERRFLLLTALLTAAYILMLSVVGGAILPRYLLPVFPPLVVLATSLVWRLPKAVARACCVAAAACFVGSWFINPPYPFPFEDNLAYADFVLLHRQAAQYLAARYRAKDNAPAARILTAWPASDELARPELGYVERPLRVVPVDGFTSADFGPVAPGSFDVVYLYSRKWEPAGNLLVRFPRLGRLQRRYFDYVPQVSEAELAARFHLKPLARWTRRGQWVSIDEVDSRH
jgi:4-amino-4-deoxy-L-arabinose transferase-like glycosyltransferase